MMQLKKNDKIIIAVAIVVVLVAAGGIAMYTPPPKTAIEEIPPDTGTSYSISWETRTSALQEINDNAGKNAPFESTVQFSHNNLKSIVFNLSWIDDLTFLGRFGLDTLGIMVTTPDGTEYEASGRSMSKTTAGNVELELSVNGMPPSVEPIIASDISEAEMKLEEMEDTTWVDQEFTITVMAQPGEIRILRKIRDKGNQFTLDISYEYYEGMLMAEETKNTGFEQEPEDEEPEIPWMSMIIQTGCGRYI